VSIQFGDTDTPPFRAVVSGGTEPYSYQWSYETPAWCRALPDGCIYTSVMPTSYHNPPNCTLKVVVTDGNGCQVIGYPPNKSTIKNEEEDMISLNENYRITNNEIKLIPNPTSGSFSIINIKDATIYLYLAQSSHIQTFERVSDNQTIDISHLPSGIYFLKIVDGNTIKNAKLILTK
jgi:hypothetical protein